MILISLHRSVTDIDLFAPHYNMMIRVPFRSGVDNRVNIKLHYLHFFFFCGGGSIFNFHFFFMLQFFNKHNIQPFSILRGKRQCGLYVVGHFGHSKNSGSALIRILGLRVYDPFGVRLICKIGHEVGF